MEVERITLPDQHYLYVDRTASFSKNDIADAMGSGFGEVYGFNQANGITPLSMPMTVYLEMPAGDTMAFRTGMFVSAEDAARADGNVKPGVIAAGDAVKTTHVGPYATLNQSHKALWDYVEKNSLPQAMPVWEIYVDDPTATPESELRTDIFRALGNPAGN